MSYIKELSKFFSFIQVHWSNIVDFLIKCGLRDSEIVRCVCLRSTLFNQPSFEFICIYHFLSPPSVSKIALCNNIVNSLVQLFLNFNYFGIALRNTFIYNIHTEGKMMTNKEIGERIRDTRKSEGKTLEDIAAEIGVARSTIQRYEKGKIDKIKLPVISAIADALGVYDAWLIGKSDKKVLSDVDRFKRYTDAFNAAHPELLEPATVKTYPVLGEVACGEPIIAEETYDVLSSSRAIKADAVVIAKGDSMTGARIYDGDIVFLRYQKAVENGQIAVVFVEDTETYDTEVTLKRFYRYGDDLIVLRAENPKYADQEYRGEDMKRIHILGLAVAFQSDLK